MSFQVGTLTLLGSAPEISVIIKDTGSGRNLMDEPVPITTLAGSGALPFILPIPKVIKASSTLEVQFNNYSGATSYDDIYLVFHGQKVFI